MRTLRLILVTAMLILPWTLTLRGAAVVAAPSVAMAEPAPAGDAPAAPNVDVHINGGDRVVWYTNPMLLAVGGIGLLLLIVVVAMAARGNGTTIIREK
jgi:hypothetical protein